MTIDKDALIERLKQEAAIHAQEARTANATIAEIYQLVTGSTGEPGNWHGAQPVREKLEAQAREIEALRAQVGAARSLLLAVDRETDPAWDCNSYHPTLAPAADALRIALRPEAEG